MTFIRPLIRLVLCIVILMVAAAAPPANADDWPKPAEWDGKSPLKGPNGVQFYKLNSIRSALLKLVGEEFYEHVILEWGLYKYIIATDDTIFVTGCKPHACSSEQVTTVVQGRTITVCVYHEFIPATQQPPPWPTERLWYLEGVGLPAVERDPDDDDLCTFESMDDLKTKLQHARALAEVD